MSSLVWDQNGAAAAEVNRIVPVMEDEGDKRGPRNPGVGGNSEVMDFDFMQEGNLGISILDLSTSCGIGISFWWEAFQGPSKTKQFIRPFR